MCLACNIHALSYEFVLLRVLFVSVFCLPPVNQCLYKNPPVNWPAIHNHLAQGCATDFDIGFILYTVLRSFFSVDFLSRGFFLCVQYLCLLICVFSFINLLKANSFNCLNIYVLCIFH